MRANRRHLSAAPRAKAERGFTLIEIMVVVIVLGILAALVLPNVIGNTDDAKVARARSDISNIEMMVEQFRLHVGRYPAEEEGLEVLRVAPTTEDADNWKGPYSKRPIPSDPWGNPYHYYAPAPDGVSPYGIESYGSDGEPGGESYAKDINTWTNYEEKESTTE